MLPTFRLGLLTLVGMLFLSTPVAGASNEDIAWKACGEQLECAKVRVPLDWDRPGGRKIKLAVIRHLASRPEERIGSLFVNPGGPGRLRSVWFARTEWIWTLPVRADST